MRIYLPDGLWEMDSAPHEDLALVEMLIGILCLGPSEASQTALSCFSSEVHEQWPQSPWTFVGQRALLTSQFIKSVSFSGFHDSGDLNIDSNILQSGGVELGVCFFGCRVCKLGLMATL